MKIYNNDVMEANRQRLGLEENDTSKDKEIMSMDKYVVFREYCQWNGLLGDWYDNLLEAVSSIYGVKLEE
jgi:hypothetical protein